MSDVVVCISMFGERRYRMAGRQAVLSVLENTDFDVFVAHDPGKPFPLHSARLQTSSVTDDIAVHSRARLFLRKFNALKTCLDQGRHTFVLSLDADAVVVTRVDRRMIHEALDGHGLGMVEQTRIRGGPVGSKELLSHYQSCTLAWFEPGRQAIPPAGFRYFNSGVVLATREKLREIMEWAGDRLANPLAGHQVGEHMIADQDYYQYWVHAVDPGCCVTLPWKWNHCRHWDDGFPRNGALVLHFSFFCQAPTLRQIVQMALLRKGQRRLNRFVELTGGQL